MIKNIFIYFLILFFCLNLLDADDSKYFSAGGIIIPIKEEKISIEKEILTLAVLESKIPADSFERFIWKVDVYFEFNNPGDNVELDVGFIAVDYGMDDFVPTTVKESNLFQDFKVNINGQEISLENNKSVLLKNNENFNERRIIIPFKMNLKHGTNIVKHTYLHKGFLQMEGVYFGRNGVIYIITTGKNWAGGVIKNFTINLSASDDTFFFLANLTGEKKEENTDVYNNPKKCKFLRKGEIISKNIINYSPESEITVSALVDKYLALGTVTKTGYGNIDEERLKKYFKDADVLIKELEPFNSFLYAAMNSECDLKKYSTATLSFLRNAIFAYYGYPFTNMSYQNFFSNYFFYIPDTNFSENKIPLDIKKRINDIIKLEKEKNKTN